MKSKNKSNPSLLPDAKPAKSSDWKEHEHVSEQVQLEAQKLVHLVGSPELAKHAINVVDQRQQAMTSDNSARASPTTIERNDVFLKALEDFESLLETPVVSGDLIDWVTNAMSACEDLGLILRDDVQRIHAELYARILREELDLASQVEKLRATDKQLSLVDFDNISKSLKQLFNRAQSAKQDEASVRLLQAEVVKQAIAFVISARTQETVIATWFSEAFNRDLGFGG